MKGSVNYCPHAHETAFNRNLLFFRLFVSAENTASTCPTAALSCQAFHSIVVFPWLLLQQHKTNWFLRRCSTRARGRARRWQSMPVGTRLRAQMEPTWARAAGIESHGGINGRKSAGKKGLNLPSPCASCWKRRGSRNADGTGTAASVLYSFQTCHERKTRLLGQAA